MKIRKRLKLKARKVKVESTFVDFDDGESVQIPLFLSRIKHPDFDVGKTLGELVNGAIHYDMVRKGLDSGDVVKVIIDSIPGGTTIVDWAKQQPGTLVDDYQ